VAVFPDGTYIKLDKSVPTVGAVRMYLRPDFRRAELGVFDKTVLNVNPAGADDKPLSDHKDCRSKSGRLAILVGRKLRKDLDVVERLDLKDFVTQLPAEPNIQQEVLAVKGERGEAGGCSEREKQASDKGGGSERQVRREETDTHAQTETHRGTERETESQKQQTGRQKARHRRRAEAERTETEIARRRDPWGAK
jgi:hypothetical protein